MRLYRLQFKLNLPLSIEETWDFFSSPYNLAKITPPSMGFEVTSEVAEKMYAGMIITYRIKPLLGIPASWVTEITHVNAPFYFVDEQRFGPYRFWHHEHHFNEAPGGIEMVDLLHYGLPFGIIGQAVNGILVQNRIREIFTYRRRVLMERFGQV